MKRKLIIGADLWKERIVATIICIVLNLDKGAKDIIQNLASFFLFKTKTLHPNLHLNFSWMV